MDAHEVSWALRAVNRASGEVEHALAQRLGLRPLDYTALGHLTDSSRAWGPAELSAALGISTGSATELVDRLERDGHVARSPHPSDRRRVVLRATEPAVGRLLAELGPLFDGLDDLSEGLSLDEQRVVARFLRAATEQMTAWVGRTSGEDR